MTMRCAILVLACLSTAYGQSRVTTGGTYKIISATNHAVLDVRDNVTYNENPIIPFPWKESDIANQLWVAKELSPHVYVFSTMMNERFALDLSRKDESELIIFEKHMYTNQQWIVEPVQPNAFTYFIRSVYSNKVIELDEGRLGVSMKVKDEHNLNQRWIFADKL